MSFNGTIKGKDLAGSLVVDSFLKVPLVSTPDGIDDARLVLTVGNLVDATDQLAYFVCLCLQCVWNVRKSERVE